MLNFTRVFSTSHKITKNPLFHRHITNLHNKPDVKVIMWEKPKMGWTKLNFDGSCRGKNGNSSIGGLFRDHKANFLMGYAEPIGRTNSILAEVAALRRGLELVLEKGWDKVWLEGDCKTLVDIILEKRKVKCEKVQGHIGHINLIMQEVKNCVLTHTYREANRAADKFAEIGHHLKRPQIWEYKPPKQVVNIMHEDANGKIFIRKRK